MSSKSDDMGVMYIFFGGIHTCRHFNEEDAREAVSRIHYTDRDGTQHTGAKWTPDEVEAATAGQPFGECVTKWDKWVAYNATYADLCKVLTTEQILAAAFVFWFADEDAPCDKVHRYVDAMR